LEPSKIVARFQSGRVLKGYTQNFFPNKPVFHLTPEGSEVKGPIEVSVDQLKAVFFVRDFVGNKTYREKNQAAPGEKPLGRLFEVTFKDGEKMVGTTSGYDPKRPGFFLFPVDQQANNSRAYIVASAVRNARFL
jgi:hypothetical protein